MKICKKCILPETFPNVTFENGECNYCRTHEISSRNKKDYLGEKKLRQIIESNKLGKYDCIVPVSGGKDSSYVLFYVARKLKLKPLAIHFDNSFTTDAAIKNVMKLCKELQVDLVIGRASNFRKKLVKEGLFVAKNLGEFNRICGNCENNLRAFSINESLRNQIPVILWGSTDFEDSSESTSSTFRERYGSPKSMFKFMMGLIFRPIWIPATFSNKCKGIFHNFKHIIFCTLDNIELNIPEGWKRILPFIQISFNRKEIEAVYFYEYIKYDPYKQIELLTDQIGYETPTGKEAKLDCKLHCLGNYSHLQKTGITRDGFYLSTLIRNGLMTQNKAFEKESIMKKDLKKECKIISKELGVEMNF